MQLAFAALPCTWLWRPLSLGPICNSFTVSRHYLLVHSRHTLQEKQVWYMGYQIEGACMKSTLFLSITKSTLVSLGNGLLIRVFSWSLTAPLGFFNILCCFRIAFVCPFCLSVCLFARCSFIHSCIRSFFSSFVRWFVRSLVCLSYLSCQLLLPSHSPHSQINVNE